MEPDLIDKILEYASANSSYAEARFVDITSNYLSYRNGEFEGLDFGRESGYAVRVVNNSISMAYSNSSRWDDVKRSVDMALERSRFRGKNSIYRGKEVKDSWKVQAKKKIEDFSIEDKTAILKENDSIMKDGGEIGRAHV